MTLVQGVAVGFLTISSAALAAQAAALATILRHRTRHSKRRGLVRTVACRVTAAGLYVCLGVASLVVSDTIALIAGFVVFSVTQLLWMANSHADLRLAQPPSPGAKHRVCRTAAPPALGVGTSPARCGRTLHQ